MQSLVDRGAPVARQSSRFAAVTPASAAYVAAMLRVGALRNKGSFSALRNLSSAANAQTSGRPQDFQDVKDALEEALEGVSYIRQSAHQAFLETEPGKRSTTEEYMMRYQGFARDELNRALEKHQSLMQSVGEETFSKLSSELKDFQLTFADSLLAKEKLDTAIRRNASKVADRAALTSRPEHQAGFINQDPCKPAWELPM